MVINKIIDGKNYDLAYEMLKELKNSKKFHDVLPFEQLTAITHKVSCHYVRDKENNYRKQTKNITDLLNEKLNDYHEFFSESKQPIDQNEIKEYVLNNIFIDEDNNNGEEKEDLEFTQYEKALIDAYSLLLNQSECIPFIEKLNEDLINFYKETYNEEPPELNKDNFESEDFKHLNLTYPKPNENYQGLPRSHVLSDFFMQFFRKYGLAENMFKWSGFIPNDLADKMFENGDYIVESRLGIGLFHGKYSHMIQQYIIIAAILSGRINWDKDKIKDFLSLTAKSKDVYGRKHRVSVFDSRVTSNRAYNDPYQLSCSIMERHPFAGKSSFLSDCLTDSHCKGVIKLKNGINKVYNLDLSIDEFYKLYKGISLEKFTSIEVDLIPENIKPVTKETTNRFQLFDVIEDNDNKRYNIIDKTRYYEKK